MIYTRNLFGVLAVVFAVGFLATDNSWHLLGLGVCGFVAFMWDCIINKGSA